MCAGTAPRQLSLLPAARLASVHALAHAIGVPVSDLDEGLYEGHQG